MEYVAEIERWIADLGPATHSFAHKAITVSGLVISAVVVLIISRIARKSIQQVLPPPQ